VKKAVCLLRQNHIFIVLTAVLLYGVFFVEHFTKVGNLYNLLLNTSLYGLIAVGMTFALLTGDVDISIGMQTAISAIVACLATSQFGFSG
jgi:ribose transport system permease protein